MKQENVLEFYGDIVGKRLLQACKDSDIAKMKQYLALPKCNVNFQDFTGWTPLHIAMKDQNEMMVKVLAKSGADETLKNRSGQTAFDLAKSYGNESIISKFKENKQ